MSTQAKLYVYGVSLRSWLDVRVPHFHICNRNGPDEGPLFLQSEAWSVREMVMDHVERQIKQEIR